MDLITDSLKRTNHLISIMKPENLIIENFENYFNDFVEIIFKIGIT